MTDDLVARLREAHLETELGDNTFKEAADRLEAAEARVRELEAELYLVRNERDNLDDNCKRLQGDLAEVYERAAMAVAGEHLTDGTGTSDDIAYDTAIDHAVNAIRNLAQGVKHEAE